MNPDPLTPDEDEREALDAFDRWMRRDREQSRDVVIACLALGVILACVAYVFLR